MSMHVLQPNFLNVKMHDGRSFEGVKGALKEPSRPIGGPLQALRQTEKSAEAVVYAESQLTTIPGTEKNSQKMDEARKVKGHDKELEFFWGVDGEATKTCREV